MFSYAYYFFTDVQKQDLVLTFKSKILLKVDLKAGPDLRTGRHCSIAPD
jgi:hypothetical protein